MTTADGSLDKTHDALAEVIRWLGMDEHDWDAYNAVLVDEEGSVFKRRTY